MIFIGIIIDSLVKKFGNPAIRKVNMKKLILLLLLFLTISVQCLAQDGIKLNSLPPSEASKYFQPLSTYFGTYFNTGAYYDANVDETFGFKFSIIGMWSIVPDDQKTFQPDPQIEGGENVEPSATIFGNHSSYFLGNKGYFIYPTGLSLKAVPLGIYQFAGSGFNTELMLRFFPESNFGDTKIGVLGFGLKHDISSHIPLFPIDLSVQILYNTLNFEYVGDEIDKYGKVSSKNFAINAHASKTFMDMFIVYSGLQYETSTTDFTYYFDDPNDYYPGIGNQRHQVTVKGKNHFRYTLGGAVKLAVVVINADLNVTSFTTFSLGFSLDF